VVSSRRPWLEREEIRRLRQLPLQEQAAAGMPLVGISAEGQKVATLCRSSTCCSSAANSVSKAFHTAGLLGCSTASRATSTGVDSTRQPPLLWRAPGGDIWPPSEHIGAGSTTGKRRGEKDIHVPTAARRDIGEDLAAEPGDEPGDRCGLRGHLGDGTLTIVMDSTVVNVTADTAGVKVKRKQPTRTRAGIEHRNRARLIRRRCRKRPGMPGRIGPPAVLRDPDVRRARDRGRDRTPRSPRVGTREAVRCRVFYTRRVGRGQC
jgi:hypothetical protein